MKKEYITSDLHLLHERIIKNAERTEYLPFSRTKAIKMSWDIVNSINQQIPDDNDVILWNLGDIYFGPTLSTKDLSLLQEFVKIMKGKHRRLNLVLGNHDRPFIQTIMNLGFDYIYDYPMLINQRYILSHEPVFLSDNQFINIHGHTHQKYVGSDYFCWVLENKEMVVKAYKDAHRKCPFDPELKKANWQQLIVNPTQYKNICWDANNYKVLNLWEIMDN